MSEKETFHCKYCGKAYESKKAMLGHQNLQCKKKGESSVKDKEENKVSKEKTSVKSSVSKEKVIGELHMVENKGFTGMVLDINGVDIPVKGSFEFKEGKTLLSLENSF